MHFLNFSLFWPLLPLVGLPLVIHWLNRLFPKKFEFSSIEEIRRTIAGRSKLFRWRHWLMLLLRTLALLALLLAFLKPVMTRRQNTGDAQRHIVLLVDHSLSMAHSENGTTALSQAHAETRRLLDSFDADDRFHLIRVDHSPTTAFPEFSASRDAALEFLKNSPAPLTHADFSSANQLVSELARDVKGPLDLYYFSDFQRRDWADVNFKNLPENARLYFVNATSNSQRENQAITQLSLGAGAIIAGGEVEITARIANFSAQPWIGKIEAGFDPAHLREREARLAPWSEMDVTLVVPIPAGGLLSLQASLPADSLPVDDRRQLVVQVQNREEVIILTPAETENASPAPSLFLRTAVDPYLGEKGVYRPRLLQPEALQPSALASTNRLIASRLPALNDDQTGSLVAFLRSGGSVIWFLDGTADAANLEKLAAISGEPLPIRLTEKLSAANLTDGAMRVASGDFRSRFLRLFEGERRQNLSMLEFYDLYHAIATGSGKTLLTYADGTPALTENQIGLGTLLLANFSVAEASSNLASQRLFPAWIHEMLLRMNTNRSAAMEPFTVGDSLSAETWTAEATGRELSGPAGPVSKVRRENLGERTRLQFVATAPGIYQLTGGDDRALLAFAVNTDSGQSDLRTIDPAILPDRAGGDQSDAEFVGATADYRELLRGRPVFHWFLFAALGALLLESVLFKIHRRPAAD